jgi:hypothetical protein
MLRALADEMAMSMSRCWTAQWKRGAQKETLIFFLAVAATQILNRESGDDDNATMTTMIGAE